MFESRNAKEMSTNERTFLEKLKKGSVQCFIDQCIDLCVIHSDQGDPQLPFMKRFEMSGHKCCASLNEYGKKPLPLQYIYNLRKNLFSDL